MVRNKYLNEFLLCICVWTALTGCLNSSDTPFSKSAEKALSTFELPPGFKIELVASEPLVSDPVDMIIDEEGRLYVVEMHGYPLDLEHTGKVILLSDKNGDGRMDERTVFAEGFTLPTGIMRWKKGIIVTDAPNVYYLEDTTGDGKADIKDTLLTGFALTNPQYLVNNPVYGLDNWIYLAHEGISETEIYPKKFGGRGTDIYYPNHPEAPRLAANAQGRIVRFRPDSFTLETTAASSQFGQTFDTWGHHFLVVNDNHIYQEVIEKKYLSRNPELIVGNTTESLSDHGDACEIFPITINPEHQLLTDVGVMTSACGIIAYQGGAFPDGYNHHVTFVCEPVSNLVHADYLRKKGATFTASRKLEHKAFLASTDAWFRPVNLYIGPDGALYVVDYYREIIEHPEWMSDKAINSGKLYNGMDKGRIYRITVSDAPPVSWTTGLNLNKLSDEQLVKKLADNNIWWRRNAQRLLVDRNHETAVGPLSDLAQHAASAPGRLHALWTLEGMNKLNIKLIKNALQDSVAGIRENAIKLAELHVKEDSGLIASLLAMKNDPDPRVRFQLLCTLGSFDSPAVQQVRQALLFDHVEDQWMQVAALSAASVQSTALLKEVISKFDPDIPAYGLLVERLARAIGEEEGTDMIYSLIKKATEGRKAWQEPLMEGLAAGLTSRETLPSGMESTKDLLIKACLHNPDVAIRRSARYILTGIGFPKGNRRTNLINRARNMAENKNLSSEKRAEAIRLLTELNPEEQVNLFKELVASNVPSVIQIAALQALSAIPDTTVSSFILAHWPDFTPYIKDKALNTFIEVPFNISRIKILLRAIRNGKINKSALGWSRSVILMRDIPEKLKEKFRDLLANQNDNRELVINNYKEALKLKGNPEKGKIVYQTNCLICHKIRGEMGVAFGPDLGTVQGWTPESILINILNPNKSIAHGYEMWAITQKDGTSSQGVITSETPNAIILRNEKGQGTTMAKKNILKKQQIETSPMPADFEKKIDKQQMADLISFIKKGNGL